MAYTINKSDGTVLGLVPSNTEYTPGTPLAGTGSTLDLTIYGRSRLSWGERVNENFVHLLENFASASSPTDPLAGQIWYDSGTDDFFYWTGSAWQALLAIDGDFTFTIPDSGLPDDSDGVLWSGDNQQSQIYVEERASEESTFVIESGSNTDAFTSFRIDSGETYPQEIMRLTSDGQMILGNYNGSVTPPTSPGYNQVTGRDRMTFNVGRGSVTSGPDIRVQEQMFLACDANITIMSGYDGGSAGSFTFAAGSGAVGLDGSETDIFRMSTGTFEWYGSDATSTPWFEIDESGNNMDLRLGEGTGGTGSSRALSKNTDGRLRINRSGDFSIVEIESDLDMDNNDIINVGDIEVDTITTSGSGDYLSFVALDAEFSPGNTNGSQTVNLNSNAGVDNDAVLVHMSVYFRNSGGGESSPELSLRTRQNGSREWTFVAWSESSDQSNDCQGFVVEKVGSEGGGGDASVRISTTSDNGVTDTTVRVHGYWI